MGLAPYNVETGCAKGLMPLVRDYGDNLLIPNSPIPMASAASSTARHATYNAANQVAVGETGTFNS